MRFIPIIAYLRGHTDDDPEMPEVHYNRGLAASELYRWDDAEESFRMALRLQEHPDYRIHLGLTLLHKKEWERGLEAFERALEFEPDNELARLHKADLNFYLTRVEGERGTCPGLCVAWFDPRLEFCETFYTSPVSKLPDPGVQHEVIKHIAAFVNTAGGFVVIGFCGGIKNQVLACDGRSRGSLHLRRCTLIATDVQVTA